MFRNGFLNVTSYVRTVVNNVEDADDPVDSDGRLLLDFLHQHDVAHHSLFPVYKLAYIVLCDFLLMHEKVNICRYFCWL